MLRERARAAVQKRVDDFVDEAFGPSSPPADDGDVEYADARTSGEFDRQAEETIPANVRMISGCHDTQTSADVSNVDTFQLPDAAGMAGGACTSAILQVIYKEEQPSSADLTFMDVFLQTRDVIKSKGFDQIPQLSSSRCIDVQQPFDLMANVHGNEGTRYAVLIGINYTKHRRGRLRGCHNDVHNICKYIMDVGKMEESNITILLDDGAAIEPTRANIMKALDDLCQKCQPGDTAFVHYSGHGGRLRDGQDPTGFNSTLCPVDFDKPGVGQILDKELYERLVCAMPAGTSLTCLMDCCHSGTVLDLPYNFIADGEHTEMEPNPDFPLLKLLAMRRALREAGVERFRDLLDDEKREQLRASYDAAYKESVGSLGRSFEPGKKFGRAARQERRRDRRENRLNW